MARKRSMLEVLEGIEKYEGTEVHLLAELVDLIRPTQRELKEKIFSRLDELILLLKQEEQHRQALASYVHRVFEGKEFHRFLVDADIVYGADLLYELRKRLSYKILPYQPSEGTVEYVLTQVFYKSGDGEWIGGLSEERCTQLLQLLDCRDLPELPPDHHWIEEILFAVKVLSHRITGRAFNREVIVMVPEYENFGSPFVALQDCLDEYLNEIREGEIERDPEHETYKQMLVLMEQCREFIAKAYKNRQRLGISLRIHQHLMAMERMLSRMQRLLGYIVAGPEPSGPVVLARLSQWVVQAHVRTRQTGPYFIKSTQLIAQEITQHTGSTGEKYITKNREGYRKMFRTAMGGGVIVGLACVAKLFLSKLDVSLFGQAFLYSMNYAIAFVAIYLLHLTLATKQPAMTAATLAATLKSDLQLKKKFRNISKLSVDVFRSQFIAFLGNVVLSFPVALLIIGGLSWASGENIAAAKSQKLLWELDPFRSPAVFHASIAGFFLFLSGLIAGQASNRSLYNRVPLRIREHPGLKAILPYRYRKGLADFYERNIGGVSSNFWFGVFMGTTGIIGIILGLPLDIRHITFAAGNFGIGLYGSGFDITWQTAMWALLGVGLIGFMNFIVSFTLSLMLALRSRAIPLSRLKNIAIELKNLFVESPGHFFYPLQEEDMDPGQSKTGAGREEPTTDSPKDRD